MVEISQNFVAFSEYMNIKRKMLPPIVLNKINLKIVVHQHSECASLDNKVLVYKTNNLSSDYSNEHQKCVSETTLLFSYRQSV